MQPQVYLREAQLFDIIAIQNIERSQGLPVTSDDELEQIMFRHDLAVAEDEAGIVVGYLLMKHSSRQTRIAYMAVHSEWSRSGIGTILLRLTRVRAATMGNNTITAIPAEENLTAQLMLKSFGFKCVKILHHHYGDGKHGYGFKLTMEDEFTEQLAPSNPSYMPPLHT